MRTIFASFVFCSFVALVSCKSNVRKDCVANRKPDCVCTMIYDPVCGCDGKTYGNACEAGCANIEIVGKGECPK